MKDIIDFFKGMLSSDRPESYTRTAGIMTLYAYLWWATYKVSGGTMIKDVDIPTNLALFLASLYGMGEYFKSKKGGADGTSQGVDQQQ